MLVDLGISIKRFGKKKKVVDLDIRGFVVQTAFWECHVVQLQDRNPYVTSCLRSSMSGGYRDLIRGYDDSD